MEFYVQIIRGEDVQTHTCRDVSPGGLFVHTDEVFRNGESVDVRISLPGTQGAEQVSGVVVRVSTSEEGGIAIRLLERNRELERFFEEQGEDFLERSSKRVFLFEPDDDARYFLRTVLGIDGYRITECADASEAWLQVSDHQYDLIIADPLVRNAQEETFMDYLTSIACSVPILFMTDGEMIGADLSTSLAHSTVQKPVVLGPFRDIVERLLRGEA